MAANTKQFMATEGVSWAKLMLAHYDRYDEQIGLRTLRLGGWMDVQGNRSEGKMFISIEVTGSDLIEAERPCPMRPSIVMQSRSWWIRGRMLTGGKVEGYFNPRKQFAVLAIEQRE